MNSTITIPARIVPLLRRGLLGELGRNAGLIDRATLEPHSDQGPDPFIGPLEALEANWMLLNEIGWQEDSRQHDITIDHATHIWALSNGLRARLQAERDHLESGPPRRERRNAQRNIRRITRYLTDNWLMLKTPPSRKLARWVRHHTHAPRHTARLPKARVTARRAERRAPTGPDARKLAALRHLLQDDRGICPVDEIAPHVGGRANAQQAISELRQAGLVYTIADNAIASLPAKTLNELHPIHH